VLEETELTERLARPKNGISILEPQDSGGFVVTRFNTDFAAVVWLFYAHDTGITSILWVNIFISFAHRKSTTLRYLIMLERHS